MKLSAQKLLYFFEMRSEYLASLVLPDDLSHPGNVLIIYLRPV